MNHSRIYQQATVPKEIKEPSEQDAAAEFNRAEKLQRKSIWLTESSTVDFLETLLNDAESCDAQARIEATRIGGPPDINLIVQKLIRSSTIRKVIEDAQRT